MRRPVCALALVLAVVIAGLGWTPAMAAAVEDVLVPHLEMATGTSWLRGDEAVKIRFELTNAGADTLHVLRWQTPVDGIEQDLFEIERDGAPVQYTGILVKRAAPTADDYLEIEPGQTVSVLFDPSASYDMSLEGEYSVRYRTALLDVRQGMTAKSAATVAPMARVRSNQVVFFMEGLPRDWASSRRLNVKKGPDCAKHPDHPLCAGGGGGGGGGGGTGAVEFVSCTSQQQSQALTAVENATTISRASADDMNDGASPYYVTWFGEYSSSRFTKVSSNFDSIAGAFEGETVTINCSDSKKPYYAYVYPTRPYEIFVCRYFFSASNLGRDSKAGTLVHEMSHFNVTAGTDDIVYGESGALNLAATSPNDAIRNADNHEYFAEDH